MSEEELYNEHKALIYMAIKQKHLYWSTDDEWQKYYDAGEIGLIKGIRNFDETKGYKISTYLFACISREILRVVQLDNLPKRKNPYGKDISLNQIVDDNSSDPSELIEFIPSDVDIEKEVEEKIKLEHLYEALECLKNKRSREIIILYYGLYGSKEHTLEEIGNKLKITKQRVARLKDLGIRRIKLFVKKKWRETSEKQFK